MAPYPKEIRAALKRVLMCRRDTGYRFTKEDLTELAEKTGLSHTVIVRWALDVRGYYNTPETMAKFFETNGPVSSALRQRLSRSRNVVGSFDQAPNDLF
jgi:hypothetical protein